MHEDIIYAKTQKGFDEVATGRHDLPMRMRRLLILVDGKSSVQSLIAKAPVLGDTPEMFDKLVAEGFVVPV